MMFIFALFVFVASLAGIVVLAANKAAVLSSLKVHNEARQLVTKAKQVILEQRLKRNTAHFWHQIRKRLMPLLGALRTRWHDIRNWAEEVEKRYQHNVEVAQQESGLITPPTFEHFIAEAERHLVAGNDEEAEAAVLKAVALDQKSIPAYKLLSRIYNERKEYNHIREIDEFLLKLDPHQADVYADLSTALVALGEADLALDAIEKAVLIEEGNPRYLDQLIELAILRKQKTLARETLARLQEVNPENEKIGSFIERIAALTHRSSSVQ